MAGFLVPVGHLLGPLFAAGGSSTPESVDVRVGDEVFSLPPRTFAVWSAAHGDARSEPFRPATREAVVAVAREAGVVSPERVLGELLAKGLLVELSPAEPVVRRFAENHRIIPLVLGLGNSNETPEIFTLGMVNEPRATASGLVYAVWMSAHRQTNLWRACENVASTTRETTGIVLDPMYVLMRFVDAMPTLLSTACVCVDRRTDG